MTKKSCRHCKTTDHQLDKDGYCRDYLGCVERRPLDEPSALRLHDVLVAHGTYPGGPNDPMAD